MGRRRGQEAGDQPDLGDQDGAGGVQVGFGPLLDIQNQIDRIGQSLSDLWDRVIEHDHLNCPACSEATTPGWNFCGRCGHDLRPPVHGGSGDL